MSIASTDDQGRVYLPKKIRERYGKKFRIVQTKDEIVLIPLAEDPLEDFQEKEALEEKTAEELKKDARESTKDQATENVR